MHTREISSGESSPPSEPNLKQNKSEVLSGRSGTKNYHPATASTSTPNPMRTRFAGMMIEAGKGYTLLGIRWELISKSSGIHVHSQKGSILHPT